MKIYTCSQNGNVGGGEYRVMTGLTPANMRVCLNMLAPVYAVACVKFVSSMSLVAWSLP